MLPGPVVLEVGRMDVRGGTYRSVAWSTAGRSVRVWGSGPSRGPVTERGPRASVPRHRERGKGKGPASFPTRARMAWEPALEHVPAKPIRHRVAKREITAG